MKEIKLWVCIITVSAVFFPCVGMGAVINSNSGDLIINEFLADGIVGDANQDGITSSVDDEFIEIVNITNNSIDISGYTIWESFLMTPRHTFAIDTIIDPFEPIVVFGGGTPTGFGDVETQVATNSDVGITFGLNLNNSSDRIVLRDDADNILFDISYDSAVDDLADQSLTMAPDLYGLFTGHATAPGSVDIYSPGTQIDGADFAAPVPLPGAVFLLGSGIVGVFCLRRTNKR